MADQELNVDSLIGRLLEGNYATISMLPMKDEAINPRLTRRKPPIANLGRVWWKCR